MRRRVRAGSRPGGAGARRSVSPADQRAGRCRCAPSPKGFRRARGSRATLRDLLGDVSIAPRRVAADVLLAAGFLATARVLSPLLGAALGSREEVGRVIGPSGAAQIAAWVLVSLAAGVGEEISFRGYLQGQFARMTSSLPAAILLQAAAFAIPHMYQGWRAALGTGVYGLAFGVLAEARKSLRPGILAHALVDVVGGIASG